VAREFERVDPVIFRLNSVQSSLVMHPNLASGDEKSARNMAKARHGEWGGLLTGLTSGRRATISGGMSPRREDLRRHRLTGTKMGFQRAIAAYSGLGEIGRDKKTISAGLILEKNKGLRRRRFAAKALT